MTGVMNIRMNGVELNWQSDYNGSDLGYDDIPVVAVYTSNDGHEFLVDSSTMEILEYESVMMYKRKFTEPNTIRAMQYRASMQEVERFVGDDKLMTDRNGDYITNDYGKTKQYFSVGDYITMDNSGNMQVIGATTFEKIWEQV